MRLILYKNSLSFKQMAGSTPEETNQSERKRSTRYLFIFDTPCAQPTPPCVLCGVSCFLHAANECVLDRYILWQLLSRRCRKARPCSAGRERHNQWALESLMVLSNKNKYAAGKIFWLFTVYLCCLIKPKCAARKIFLTEDWCKVCFVDVIYHLQFSA